jgi:hypothetical protein
MIALNFSFYSNPIANELAKILNKKLIDQYISLAKEISNNSFTAVKTSKMLTKEWMQVLIQDYS